MGTITGTGLDVMAYLLSDYFTYVANGTGTTAEATTDTSLAAENTLYGSARKTGTVTFSSDKTGTTIWNVLFSFTDTVIVREYGIFTSSSGGSMLYRRVLSANRTYQDADSMELTITHTFARS
jgi:hypothetical protein